MLKNPDFDPEINIRILQGSMDLEKAILAADKVFKHGIQGKTRVEVVDIVNPGLRKNKEALAAKVSSIKRRIAKADYDISAMAVDLKKLQRTYNGRVKKYNELAEKLDERKKARGRTAGQPRTVIQGEIEELQSKLMDLESQIEAGEGVVRPEWALFRPKAGTYRAGKFGSLTNQELIAVARHENVNPYMPDWFDGLDTKVIAEAHEGRFKAYGVETQARLKQKQIRVNRLLKLAKEEGEANRPLSGDLDDIQTAADSRKVEVKGGPDIDVAEDGYGRGISFLAGQIREIELAVRSAEREALGFVRRSQKLGGEKVTLAVELDDATKRLKDMQEAYAAVDIRPYTFVKNGVYRYFPNKKEADAITRLREVSTNKIIALFDDIRATAFGGGTYPQSSGYRFQWVPSLSQG